MQSSILIEESSIIKAGLILLWIITHMLLVYGVGEWLCFLSAGKVFLPLLISSAPSTHPFGNQRFRHYMLYLSPISFLFTSVSSDISHSPSPACPRGKIELAVKKRTKKKKEKKRLNLTYAVELWVDPPPDSSRGRRLFRSWTFWHCRSRRPVVWLVRWTWSLKGSGLCHRRTSCMNTPQGWSVFCFFFNISSKF